ncbi:MAG: hypothetical protein H6573_22570 [Lewinellaceae bacterium]|nr:hypothetical protein [Lewinellaceae bacterium]
MMAEKKEKKIIFEDILVLLEILLAWMRAGKLLRDFFWHIGYDLKQKVEPGEGVTTLDKVIGVSEILYESVTDLEEALATRPQDIKGFKKYIEYGKHLKEWYETLKQNYDELSELLDQEGNNPDGELDFEEVFKHIGLVALLKTLEGGVPQVFHLLRLLSVIKPAQETEKVEPYVLQALGDSPPKKFPHQRPQIHWDRFGNIFSDPKALLKQEYFPEGFPMTEEAAKAVSEKLFPVLADLARSLGGQAVFGIKPLPEFGEVDDPELKSTLERTLTFWYSLDDEQYDAGASLVFAPTEENGIFDLIVRPFGEVEFSKTTGNWQFKTAMSAHLEAFAFGEDGVKFPDEFGDNSIWQSEFAVRKVGAADNGALVIGGEKGARLEVGSLGLLMNVFLSRASQELDVMLEVDSATFFLGSGDGDSFLAKVLPEDEVRVDFDMGIGWSTKQGVHLKGSGGLELNWPVGISIGKYFVLPAIQFGIKAETDGIAAYVTASGKTKLGPFFLNIEKLGIIVSLRKSEDAQGNALPPAFDLDFKYPESVGIIIDAKHVKGGGFLKVNPGKGEYAGIAELSIKGKITLQALALINTQLPDGKKGFSFLLIVNSKFPPIQLGLGFTLRRVGGLVGINRSVNTEALHKKIGDANFTDVLYPQNPVEKAAQVISRLSTTFPPREGQYVFGILGEIGWGAGDLFVLEAGLILELPAPWRILLIGKLSSRITKKIGKKEIVVVKLDVNFVGELNFDDKYAAFDAEIVKGSKVLMIEMRGSLAFRLTWGRESGFVISAGGFYPAWEPPSLGLPSYLLLDPEKMKRLELVIYEDNPVLKLFCYLAITSNTLQFGASLHFNYSWKFFHASAKFGFDTIFTFSPFRFEAGLYAMVEVKIGSTTVAKVDLKGILGGPSPWTFDGEATFSIWIFDYTVSVHKEWGDQDDTRIDTIEAQPLLVEALQDQRNWRALPPPGRHQLVFLHQEENLEEEEEEVLRMQPEGALSISQSVLPLELRLDKVGDQPISGQREFALDALVNDQVVEMDRQQEEFAPGQYLNFTKDEKVSLPPYESFQSGGALQRDALIRSSLYREKEAAYEIKVYDSGRAVPQAEAPPEEEARFNRQLEGGSLQQSELGRMAVTDQADFERAIFAEKQYAIVLADGLAEFGDINNYRKGGNAMNRSEAATLIRRIEEEQPELEDRLTLAPVGI